ncbi:hypothetical protein NliqN6_3883 [Naganishia liquefaciens]|uniref:Uncharacterized protein n=1 Tax=Naganishia liquefaciens TaxID=104408 RepID=A0A8H3TTY1_9TREE|nr:hypothetical protein NliqN6_3883 [Naganishia liquefaciens]
MAQPRLQLFPLPPDDTVCPGTLLEVEQDCHNFIYEAQHALGDLRAEFPSLADFAFPQDAEFKGMGRIGRTVWEAIAHVIIRRGGLMVPEYAIQPANLANPICLQCLKPFPRPQSGQIASVVPHPCRPVHYLAQILYRVARRGRVVDVGRHRDLVWLLMDGDQEGNLALPQVQAREEMVVAQWQEAVDGIQLELEEAERKVKEEETKSSAKDREVAALNVKLLGASTSSKSEKERANRLQADLDDTKRTVQRLERQARENGIEASSFVSPATNSCLTVPQRTKHLSQIRELQAQLKADDRKSQQQSLEIQKLREDDARAQREHQRISVEVSAAVTPVGLGLISEQLTQLKSALSSSEADKKQLERAAAARDTKVAQLEDQASKDKAQAILNTRLNNELKERAEAAEARLTEAEVELQGCNTALSRAKDELLILEASDIEKDNQLVEIKETLVAREASVLSQEHTIANLQKEYKTATDEISVLQIHLAEWKRKGQTLQSNIEELRVQEKQTLTAHQAEVDQARIRADELNRLFKEADARCKKLEAHQQELHNAATEAAAKLETLAELEEEIGRTREARDTAVLERDALQAEAKSLADRVNDLKRLESKNSDLSQRLQAAQTTLEDRQRMIATQETEGAQRRQDLAAALQEIQRLRAELESQAQIHRQILDDRNRMFDRLLTSITQGPSANAEAMAISVRNMTTQLQDANQREASLRQELEASRQSSVDSRRDTLRAFLQPYMTQFETISGFLSSLGQLSGTSLDTTLHNVLQELLDMSRRGLVAISMVWAESDRAITYLSLYNDLNPTPAAVDRAITSLKRPGDEVMVLLLAQLERFCDALPRLLEVVSTSALLRKLDEQLMAIDALREDATQWNTVWAWIRIMELVLEVFRRGDQTYLPDGLSGILSEPSRQADTSRGVLQSDYAPFGKVFCVWGIQRLDAIGSRLEAQQKAIKHWLQSLASARE